MLTAKSPLYNDSNRHIIRTSNALNQSTQSSRKTKKLTLSKRETERSSPVSAGIKLSAIKQCPSVVNYQKIKIQ